MSSTCECVSGPIVNPFPLVAGHGGGRVHAHRNPMEPFRRERAGLYRPKVPARIPRNIPDEAFNEVFARLPSNRDRALVAFFVSTGARAAELLGVRQGGVDAGGQLISVVRKGSRAAQQLPASADAFVWLRLYQAEIGHLVPQGPANRCGGRCAGRIARSAITLLTGCSSGPARRWARTGRCTICGIPPPTGWPKIRRCR